MIVPALDEHTALLVVDFQVATTARALAHDIDVVAANGTLVATAFREHGCASKDATRNRFVLRAPSR